MLPCLSLSLKMSLVLSHPTRCRLPHLRPRKNKDADDPTLPGNTPPSPPPLQILQLSLMTKETRFSPAAAFLSRIMWGLLEFSPGQRARERERERGRPASPPVSRSSPPPSFSLLSLPSPSLLPQPLLFPVLSSSSSRTCPSPFSLSPFFSRVSLDLDPSSLLPLLSIESSGFGKKWGWRRRRFLPRWPFFLPNLILPLASTTGRG